MSEERFEQDKPEDEDVEAHKKAVARKVEATEEPGTEESDDVEAHRKVSQHKNL
jgi:hypothetical protein